MYRLSPVEAFTAQILIEESLKKLSFLNSISTSASIHRDELTQFMGDEISRIIQGREKGLKEGRNTNLYYHHFLNIFFIFSQYFLHIFSIFSSYFLNIFFIFSQYFLHIFSIFSFGREEHKSMLSSFSL
jgi:hypothetical protein